MNQLPKSVTVAIVGCESDIRVRAIGDVQGLFDKLSDEGLVSSGAFRVESYREGQQADQLVRELAEKMFDPISPLPTIEARSECFEYLLKYPKFRAPPEHIPCRNRIPESWYSEILATADNSRNRLKLEGRVKPPTVLLLSARFQPAFDGAHGIANPGEWTCQVSPWNGPGYYRQIIWHEVLHACFGLADCYDEINNEDGKKEHPRKSTCDLQSCIMQWEPINSDPDSGPWLCAKQREKIGAVN